MATYATPLGAMKPGVVFRNTTGSFSSVASNGFASTAQPQVLVSTGASSYAFVPQQNMPSPPYSTGIVQMALTNVGGATPYPIYTTQLNVVGSDTSNYDAAAVVLSGTFTPYNAMSTVQVDWAMTINNTQDFAWANLYIYPNDIPTPFGTSNNAAYQAGDISNKVSGTVFLSGLSFLDEIPFAICVFKSGTGTTGGISPYDYVLITEYANTNPQPPQSVNVILSNATPVTLFTVDLSGNGLSASQYISGTVLYADMANLISNTQTFQILIQYNFTSNTTTCTVGPGNAIAANPFLTYTIAGNVVSINAVGLAGETFNTTCNYTFLQGSI